MSATHHQPFRDTDAPSNVDDKKFSPHTLAVVHKGLHDLGTNEQYWCELYMCDDTVLKIRVEHDQTMESWVTYISDELVEKITKIAKSPKDIDVFRNMLKAALTKQADSLAITLVDRAKLEEVYRKNNSRRVSYASTTSTQDKNDRYLILDYRSEFDLIHYPIKLLYEQPKDTSLWEKLVRCKQERDQLRQWKAENESKILNRTDIKDNTLALRQEIEKLRREKSTLEKAFTKLERESSQEIQQIKKECEILAADLDGQGDEMLSLKRHLQDSGTEEIVQQYRRDIQALKKQLKQVQEESLLHARKIDRRTSRSPSPSPRDSKKLEKRTNRSPSPSPRTVTKIDIIPKKPVKRSVTPRNRSPSPTTTRSQSPRPTATRALSPRPTATRALSPRPSSPRPASPRPPRPQSRSASVERKRSPSPQTRKLSGSQSERKKDTRKRGLSVRDPNKMANVTTRTKKTFYATTSDDESGTEFERPLRRKSQLHYTYTDDSDVVTRKVTKRNLYESSDSEVEKENRLYNTRSSKKR